MPRLPESPPGYVLVSAASRGHWGLCAGPVSRKRLLFIVVCIALAGFLLAVSDTRVHERLRDPCRSWDAHAADIEWEAANPACLRAQQFRQIAHFSNLPQYDALKEPAQQMTIKRIARCALGITKCPERPLIIVDWLFVYNYHHETGVRHGEEVWIEPIIEAIKDMGFELLVFKRGEEHSWDIARLLDKSIHMYLTDVNQAFRCFHSPFCVRPEDYVAPANESLAIPVPPERHNERGTLPAWRIFGLSFWGARPDKYNAVYLDTAGHWGVKGNDGREEWSHHVLGNKWTITPFNYPGHTHIPITIEQACTLNRVVPPSEREDAVLVLAKSGDYFLGQEIKGMHGHWDQVVQSTKAFGVDLWTTAFANAAQKIPHGIVQLGIQSPKEYIQTLSKSKAFLGIGMPSISPSPYEALCMGVPLVFPQTGNHTPAGWDMYQPHWFQHGPLQALSPPHVYSYDSSDPQDLINKIHLAVSTPIEPFIPPEMTLKAVYARVAQVINHDWEKEYHAVRAANGGRNPGYKDGMFDLCFARGVCDPKILSDRP